MEGADWMEEYMAAPQQANKDTIRRMNDEVWGEGDLDLIDEYVAADYVEHNTASPQEIRGPDGYRENVEMVRAAFPDMDVITENLIAEGDKVVYRYTITGTHQGPLMGIDPTGKGVEISGIGIAQIEDGNLVESWSNVDSFGMMHQLGVVEPPA